jgi:hypothetical protein
VVVVAGLETALPETTMPAFSLRNLPAGGSRDERRGDEVELMAVVPIEAERRRGPRRDAESPKVAGKIAGEMELGSLRRRLPRLDWKVGEREGV